MVVKTCLLGKFLIKNILKARSKENGSCSTNPYWKARTFKNILKARRRKTEAALLTLIGKQGLLKIF